jgi:hypothetical protein
MNKKERKELKHTPADLHALKQMGTRQEINIIKRVEGKGTHLINHHRTPLTQPPPITLQNPFDPL